MPRLTTEERQKNIIDEALNIIHEGGYEALSIREIASRVKISEPAIYRHFLNKEDIVLGILSRISDFDLELEKAISEKNSEEEKLEEFILFHFKFLENNKNLTSVIFSEEIFTQSKILKEKMMKIMTHMKMMLKRIVEEAQNKSKIKNVHSDDLVTMIMGFIRLNILEWKLNEFSFSLVNKGEKVTATLKTIIFK